MTIIKKAMLLALATATVGIAAAQEKIGLGGNCPVCYIAANKAAKGDAAFASVHEGVTYHFVDEKTKKMFEAEPVKFLPQYDGFCAYGMSLGKKFESDPSVFKVIEGRLFLNKSADVAKLFAKDTASHIVKADKSWKEMEMKEKEMKMKEMKEKEMMAK